MAAGESATDVSRVGTFVGVAGLGVAQIERIVGMRMLGEPEGVVMAMPPMVEGEHRVELMRFRDLLFRFNVPVSGDEGEALAGPIRPLRLHRHVCGGPWRTLEAKPEPRRHAVLVDGHVRLPMARVDDLLLAVGMTVVMMVVLVAPRAPQHPRGDA